MNRLWGKYKMERRSNGNRQGMVESGWLRWDSFSKTLIVTTYDSRLYDGGWTGGGEEEYLTGWLSLFLCVCHLI